MSPRNHLLISILTGFFFASISGFNCLFEIVFVSVIAGTIIDLDHFILGRFYHGDWRFLKTTVSNFWDSFNDIQSVVGEEIDMPKELRILSHSLILFVIMSISYSVDLILLDIASYAIITHILTDLFSDCISNNIF